MNKTSITLTLVLSLLTITAATASRFENFLYTAYSKDQNFAKKFSEGDVDCYIPFMQKHCQELEIKQKRTQQKIYQAVPIKAAVFGGITAALSLVFYGIMNANEIIEKSLEKHAAFGMGLLLSAFVTLGQYDTRI